MKEIWLVIQESEVAGQLYFNVVPCASEEAAKQVMLEEVSTLMNEGHFIAYIDRPYDFKLKQTETSYCIEDTLDAYYEDIRIEKREITTL